MKKIDRVLNYFDSIITNPHCELIYHKDYELLIAVMLSAQTTDKRVNQVTQVLFKKYPTLEDIKNASIIDIENIIRPIGTFKKKALNTKIIAERLLEETNGKVINDRKYLETLPGVGRKTTNVVLSEIFNVPVIAVDTHVARVSKRLGLVKYNDDVFTIEKKLTNKIPKERLGSTHHQFILFGRYYCKAISPLCDTCELKDICKKDKQKK
jgi:endonuclease-3